MRLESLDFLEDKFLEDHDEVSRSDFTDGVKPLVLFLVPGFYLFQGLITVSGFGAHVDEADIKQVL